MAERGGLHLHTRLLIEISEHAIARSIAMCTSVVLSFQASRNDRSRVANLDFEDLSTLPPTKPNALPRSASRREQEPFAVTWIHVDGTDGTSREIILTAIGGTCVTWHWSGRCSPGVYSSM